MVPGDVGISVVTYFELTYGAWNSQHVERNLESLEELRRVIPVVSLSTDSASAYGRVRKQLERAGMTSGGYDLMIAAHALSLGVTLVTNSIREFSRVEGLTLENWA